MNKTVGPRIVKDAAHDIFVVCTENRREHAAMLGRVSVQANNFLLRKNQGLRTWEYKAALLHVDSHLESR